MLRDLRLACRSLVRSPAPTLVVLLTLGLGVGAVAAVYSFLQGLLLAQPPFQEPDQLVRIHALRGGETGMLSLREVRDLDEALGPAGRGVFEQVSAYIPGSSYTIGEGAGAPEQALATLVTGDLFATLGVELPLGEPWPASFDRERNFGVVLAHGFWQRRFGGDPTIVGRTITLDAAPGYTVFGVAPPGFEFPVRADLYRSPAIYPAQIETRSVRGAFAVARLAPGVTLETATAEVVAMGERLARVYPETNRGMSLTAHPLGDLWTGRARPYLVFLSIAVVFVFGIACANVANILLVSSIRREGDVAVRLALGSGRGALLRTALFESLILGVAGAVLGFGLAVVAVELFSGLSGAELPPWMEIEVDAAVLAVASAAGLTGALFAGFFSVWRSTSPDLGLLLRVGGRAGQEGGRRRLRQGFVVGQIASATVLLISAGLMLQSFWNIERTELGMKADGLLTFRLALPWMKYSLAGEDTVAFYDQLLGELATLPGVEEVALHSSLPFSSTASGAEGDDGQALVTLEGQSPDAQGLNPPVLFQRVTPSWFDLAQIALLDGRYFTASDRRESVPVAIVSRSLAERLWPGRSALGERLKLGEADAEAPWIEIVGVVADVHQEHVNGASALGVYVPFFQQPSRNQYVALRTTMPPATLADDVVGAVRQIDPDQAVYDLRSVRERIDEALWQQRLASALLVLFAALALVLAAVGIYGIMSYSVAQRTREIGVRMALGADRSATRHLVLRQTSRLSVLGVVIGLVGALALSRVMKSLLYGLAAFDWRTYTLVAFVLVGVALLAAWFPSARATRIDPSVTLRSE